MPTPSETLGARIATRLVEEGLLTPDEIQKLLPNLIDGSLKPEDWRLAVELSAPEEKRDDEGPAL